MSNMASVVKAPVPTPVMVLILFSLLWAIARNSFTVSRMSATWDSTVASRSVAGDEGGIALVMGVNSRKQRAIPTETVIEKHLKIKPKWSEPRSSNTTKGEASSFVVGGFISTI